MSFVADSNILLRVVQDNHPHHPEATRATASIIRQGETVYVLPQNLYELWVVATRPIDQNGLGMSAAEASAELAKIKGLFQLLGDTPDIYPEWERLVSRHKVLGKNAHDARIVAAMITHRITHLLTFNVDDFNY